MRLHVLSRHRKDRHNRVHDFTVDEGGSAEPTRYKNITGMHRRRGVQPPLLCDPGWVV